MLFPIAALAFSLASTPAQATSYATVLGMQDLLDRSDNVVRGTVKSTTGRWTDGGYIETEVEIEVLETYLGRPGHTLTIIAPGGAAVSEKGGKPVELHIEGAARFEVGQEVVVFARGRTLVGFGQGAFLVKEGRAVRALGNAAAGRELDIDLNRAFGVSDDADTCMQNHLRSAYSEGWSLRTAVGSRLSDDEVGIFEVTLLADTEYRLHACTDALVDGATILLSDTAGEVLVKSSGGQDPELIYIPERTGTFYIGVSTDGMAPEVWRSALSVGVSYR